MSHSATNPIFNQDPLNVKHTRFDRIAGLPSYILFLPLLFAGVLIILLQSENANLFGDEPRYYNFAYNLIQGFYSPNMPEINLCSGPGYPIMLMPMAWLDLPLIWWKLLNAVMLYFSGILFFKTLNTYFPRSTSLICSAVVWGLVFYMNKHIYRIYSENATILTVAAFAYYLTRFFQKKSHNWTSYILPAFMLAALTLTKVVVAYVVIAIAVISVPLYFILRDRNYLKAIVISGWAMLFCVPYLAYTYHLTGKMFYWSNWGGDNLYWMSTLLPNETGNWKNWEKSDAPMVHREFYQSISHLDKVAWDEALKAKSMENIKSNPLKYLNNWVANVERLLFNLPFDHQPQQIMFRFIVGCFIVFMSVIALYPTLMAFRRIPFEILYLIPFVVFYLGGNSLVSVDMRQFYVIFPLFGLWISYVFVRFIRFDFSKPGEAAPESPSLNSNAHFTEQDAGTSVITPIH